MPLEGVEVKMEDSIPHVNHLVPSSTSLHTHTHTHTHTLLNVQ